MAEETNPWEVESLQDFLFLKCPECTFDTKEENFFQMHAVDHHPLSIVFFDETCKKEPTIIKEGTAKVKSEPVFLIEIDGETLIKPKGSKSSELKKCSKIKELNDKFFESIETGSVGNGCTFGPGPPISMDNEEHNMEHMEEDFETEIPEFGRQNFPEEPMIMKRKTIEVEFESISVDIHNSIQIKTLIEPPGESNKCSICNVNFSSLSDVNRHIEFVHERKKPDKCEICGASYKRHYKLKAHVLRAHKGTDFYDGRDYKCSICDRASTSENGLQIHIKTVHGGNKPHKCLICPMSFSTKYRVEIHTKTIHETDNAFKCTLCKSSYKAEMNLKRHITTVHEGKNQFACFNCDDSFVLRKELDAHMEFAHDLKYNCSECEMSYGDKANLLDHLKYVHENHEKIKPHKCPTCDACFDRVKLLQEHIDAVHEKKKPHLCSLCGFGFAYKSALKAHIGNVHERKKSDLCSLCGKAFYSTSRMKRHFRIVHEGMKEKREVLSCPHCDAMLKGKKSLKIHIESVHEKKRFKCTICDNTYSQRNNMMRHISTDHKDKKD